MAITQCCECASRAMVEGGFYQQVNENFGLDHFEPRSCRGLRRHALMTLIALLFLQYPRLHVAKSRKSHSPRPIRRMPSACKGQSAQTASSRPILGHFSQPSMSSLMPKPSHIRTTGEPE